MDNGLDSYCHHISGVHDFFFFFFCLWLILCWLFSPCCTVVMQSIVYIVALLPFVLAIVGIPHLLLMYIHSLFFHHITALRFVFSHFDFVFFQFISYCSHSWQLCPAIKCSQLFSMLVWKFLFLIPHFCHCHWLITSQITQLQQSLK